VLGEFARSSVLAGQQALPAKLEKSGYRFVHTELGTALRVALGRD
jgi:NAD dependent epimerase/dehydratase family enzyme